MNTAENAYAAEDKKFIQQQCTFQNLAYKSCDALNECCIKDWGIKAFECYASKGSAAGQVFFKISSDANVHMRDLEKEYREIDSVLESCNAKAQRIFEDATVEAGNVLKKCFNNS
ncbi:uncharacterized protein LOC124419123 [Lucilia cuprina]|uniref:uncharacterized protein LOC124419123 n=1 Tax=Lucilia cuprina TaxID=7375 RepID=UPI001F0663B7|nr:uncharacterized protein LOC124419123 [Lucilia cuprina]